MKDSCYVEPVKLQTDLYICLNFLEIKTVQLFFKQLQLQIRQIFNIWE